MHWKYLVNESSFHNMSLVKNREIFVFSVFIVLCMYFWTLENELDIENPNNYVKIVSVSENSKKRGKIWRR